MKTIAVAAGLLAGACTIATLAPDAPVSVASQPIAPWEIHETCAQAAIGDRIDFRYEASQKVDFDLYYRQGPAVIIPLSREGVTAASGVFQVAIPGRYCLAWKAGAAGAMVGYHVTVHSATR